MMKRKVVKFVLILLIGGIIMYLTLDTINTQNSAQSTLRSPVAHVPSITAVLSSPTPIQSSQNGLKQAVENSLEGTIGTYGVVVKNLKTSESYYSNEHRVFEPGSLYKVWIMAAAFDQIKNGELDGDEILSEDISVLNEKFNIASEDAEMTEGTIALSVKDALEQMITISHNYAALLLTEKIKLSNVALFLKENAFDESTVGINGASPTSTPSNIALFFEKLYKGELADLTYTQKMLDLLKKQTLNEKLPKYLPKDVVVAHKTGEIDYLTHDAGIVFSDKGDYIIVVMSESTFPPGAEDRIAGVSKAVYEYFSKK